MLPTRYSSRPSAFVVTTMLSGLTSSTCEGSSVAPERAVTSPYALPRNSSDATTAYSQSCNGWPAAGSTSNGGVGNGSRSPRR